MTDIGNVAAQRDVDALVAANAELYAAIEAGDVDRLGLVWDTGDDVVCVHPGWPALRGRSRVLRSYSAIMANTSYIQFFGTGTDVDLLGDVAVVTCAHSLLTRIEDAGATGEVDGGHVGADDLGETARVVSTNVFWRTESGWRLRSHHSSPIMASQDVARD